MADETVSPQVDDPAPGLAPIPEGDPRLELPAGMFVAGPEAGRIGVDVRRNGIKVVEPMAYTLHEGFAFVEGDILIGTAEQVSAPTAKGLVRTGEQFRWPGGVLVYAVEDASLQERVDLAIEHWTRRTPIKFKKRTNEEDFVAFVNQGGCFSSVGRVGGRQLLSLGPRCNVGAAIHEIGHALGLWHEQSRGDRDEFVTVLLDKISVAHRHNFDKHVIDGTMVGPYDFDSIMHYPAVAFSIDNRPTIIPKVPGQQIGQRNGLSKGDRLAIQRIYPDLDWSQFPIT